jgi:methyl-accepting chemotaxis protein
MIRGNLSARVNVISHDEVGVLTESFNTMVEELNNRRRRLLKTFAGPASFAAGDHSGAEFQGYGF